jgi:hypothetical protein
MTTPQGQPEKDLVTSKFDAELREADARLKVLQARAEATKAKADMDEISGLAAARERVRKNVADLKQEAAADYAATKREVEKEIRQLQDGIQRVNERVMAWDAARERQFYARLDEAEAKLEVWKAKGAQKRADVAIKVHDDFATLEEKIELARARSATAKSERYSAKSLTALEEAERHFNQAYAAAAKRYETA